MGSFIFWPQVRLSLHNATAELCAVIQPSDQDLLGRKKGARSLLMARSLDAPPQLGMSRVGPQRRQSCLAAGHRPCSVSVLSPGRGQPGPGCAQHQLVLESPLTGACPPRPMPLDLTLGLGLSGVTGPGIPGPVELSTRPNCKGLSCSAPTHPASSESSRTSCPTVPPAPESARQRAGEAGLVVAALDSTLGRGLGGGQRLAGDRGWLGTGRGGCQGPSPGASRAPRRAGLRGARAPRSAGHTRAGPAPSGAPMPNACTTRHCGVALGMAGCCRVCSPRSNSTRVQGGVSGTATSPGRPQHLPCP